jgi:hypothetical protein
MPAKASDHKQALVEAVRGYGSHDKIFLSDLFAVLKSSYNKPLLLDTCRGLRYLGMWIKRIERDEQEHVDVTKLLGTSDIKKITQYCNNFLHLSPANVFELYAIHHAGRDSNRTLLNISTFCLGAFAYSVSTKRSSTLVVVDSLFDVLNNKYGSITRANATKIGERCLKYFGFITTCGLDGLFSTYYSKEKITKCNKDEYHKILTQDKIFDRTAFDFFISNVNNDDVLLGFINEAMIVYDKRNNESQNSSSSGSCTKSSPKLILKCK